jgi:hypothetical protein
MQIFIVEIDNATFDVLCCTVLYCAVLYSTTVRPKDLLRSFSTPSSLKVPYLHTYKFGWLYGPNILPFLDQLSNDIASFHYPHHHQSSLFPIRSAPVLTEKPRKDRPHHTLLRLMPQRTILIFVIHTRSFIVSSQPAAATTMNRIMSSLRLLQVVAVWCIAGYVALVSAGVPTPDITVSRCSECLNVWWAIRTVKKHRHDHGSKRYHIEQSYSHTTSLCFFLCLDLPCHLGRTEYRSWHQHWIDGRHRAASSMGEWGRHYCRNWRCTGMWLFLEGKFKYYTHFSF